MIIVHPRHCNSYKTKIKLYIHGVKEMLSSLNALCTLLHDHREIIFKLHQTKQTKRSGKKNI